jgi:hypothetical protein
MPSLVKKGNQSRQRGLNSRNILSGNINKSNPKQAYLIPNYERLTKSKKKCILNRFEHSKPPMDIDTVVKGKSYSPKQISQINSFENRFIIPNLNKNVDLQLSLFGRTHELLHDVVTEISEKVPLSPSVSPSSKDVKVTLVD